MILKKSSEKKFRNSHPCYTSFHFMLLTDTGLLNRYNLKKLSYEERKARLIERLNALNAGAVQGDEDDE